MTSPLIVGSRVVGPGYPCYVVAELSANHNHQLDRAIEIIRAAKDAGADAVKLQTYRPDTLTIDSDREWFRVKSGLWAGRTLFDLYGEAHTPWDWHTVLFDEARSLGLDCFSTPFDVTAIELLEGLNAPIYKVASFELVDLELLRQIGATQKPVILSTGMASEDEIAEAVSTLREAGSGAIALLKCTSAYPAPPESMNLRTIPYLARRFDVVVGLSDHTLGGAVAVAAVALGACVIEKHFTLRRADGGPDSAFSMEPEEFAAMVREVRVAERAMGDVSFARTEQEQASLVFRRSLFVVSDMRAGDAFSGANVRAIRPGYGLQPRELPKILGRSAAQSIPRGTPLSWDLVGQ